MLARDAIVESRLESLDAPRLDLVVLIPVSAPPHQRRVKGNAIAIDGDGVGDDFVALCAVVVDQVGEKRFLQDTCLCVFEGHGRRDHRVFPMLLDVRSGRRWRGLVAHLDLLVCEWPVVLQDHATSAPTWGANGAGIEHNGAAGSRLDGQTKDNTPTGPWRRASLRTTARQLGQHPAALCHYAKGMGSELKTVQAIVADSWQTATLRPNAPGDNDG